jgi:gamma-glutamylcyclotransferase
MLLNYFAYGSNMSLARMGQRIPSASSKGLAILEQHQLCFHKVSRDGSAKCDALSTGDPLHRIFGVLYTIAAEHKPLLDRVEGAGIGYEEKAVRLVDRYGNQATAFTYCATRIDSSLLPYSWYLNHVLIGAREASLPDSYIKTIADVLTKEDQDLSRSCKELAIHFRRDDGY